MIFWVSFYILAPAKYNRRTTLLIQPDRAETLSYDVTTVKLAEGEKAENFGNILLVENQKEDKFRDMMDSFERRSHLIGHKRRITAVKSRGKVHAQSLSQGGSLDTASLDEIRRDDINDERSPW